MRYVLRRSPTQFPERRRRIGNAQELADPIRNDTLDVAFDGLDDARERECLRLRDDASERCTCRTCRCGDGRYQNTTRSSRRALDRGIN